jgi:hypothetical protein
MSLSHIDFGKAKRMRKHALLQTASNKIYGIPKFELPRDYNTGLVRSRTLSNLGLAFRNFKSRMWSQYGQKDKMPDWDKYPLLKPYWSGFKKYKQSEEATKISQESKMNAKKKVLHHTMGSCGYVGKEETWQEQEEKAIQLGATLATTN